MLPQDQFWQLFHDTNILHLQVEMWRKISLYQWSLAPSENVLKLKDLIILIIYIEIYCFTLRTVDCQNNIIQAG